MNNITKRFIDVSENWKKRIGKNELLRHLNGKPNTRNQAIKAKCYDCCGGYSDAKPEDCNVPACPLYQYMPYRKKI